jgi:hypothetical protein
LPTLVFRSEPIRNEFGRTKKELKAAMTINMISITGAMLIAVAVLPAQAGILNRHHVTLTDPAAQSLKDLHANAAAAEDEAMHLRTLSLTPEISADSHMVALMALKQQVNAMGREIDALNAERSALARWEVRAVDHVRSLLKSAASDTDNAIAFFNDNRDRLWLPAYRADVEGIESDAARIAEILKADLRHAKSARADENVAAGD